MSSMSSQTDCANQWFRNVPFTFFTFVTLLFTTVLSQWDFSHGKFELLPPGESQLRQTRSTHTTVHAGCFSVSIIHRTRTWTTESLTCAQMLMHATAYGGCTDTVRESALKVDSGRKIPCRTGDSNLRQRRAGPMLYQLSYTPIRESYESIVSER